MELYEKIADLALLWRRVGEVFPRLEEVTCDWDQAFYDFLPRLAGADDRQSHLLFAEFLNLLGDGHTDYRFPKPFLKEIGFLPFSLRYCGGIYFIDACLPEMEPFLGSIVEKIDGRPFRDLLEEAMQYSYHVGTFMPESRLCELLPLLLPGKAHKMETSKGKCDFRLLPEKPELNPAGRPGEIKFLDLENRILYANLPDFLYGDAAEKLSAALQEGAPSGLILDIRQNIGGMTLFGAQVAELLIPGEFSGCQKKTRIMKGVELAAASQILLTSPEAQAREIAEGLYTQEYAENSRRQMAGTYTESYQDRFGQEGQKALFTGPCVVLTSRRTVSAAEDFLAMLRSNHRAQVIGTPTCGTTGTPMLLRLRSGGSAWICSVGYRLLDGTRFLGCGIQPDIRIEPTPEDILAGEDPVLERAMALLAHGCE